MPPVHVHPRQITPFSIFTVVPLVLFAYTCQPNVLQIQEELQRSSIIRGRKFIYRGLGIAFLLYVLVGSFGFLTFFDEYTTKDFPGQILDADYGSSNDSIIVATFAILISVVTGTPLCFHPCREAILGLLWKGQEISKKKYMLVVSAIVFSSLCFALFVPGVIFVVSLLGCLSSPVVRLI